MPRPLRVAETPAEAPPRPSQTVSLAASQGSRLDLLAAMRDLIAADLDKGVPARDLASLTKRLLEITKEIEAIHAASSGDDVGAAAATPDAAWPAS